MENNKQEVVEGTREVENSFLGGRVLLDLHELKFGVVTLQSCKRFEYLIFFFSVMIKGLKFLI